MQKTKGTIARFISPDNRTVLTVKAALSEKTGSWRVLASLKIKGSDQKATTGARESFKTASEAEQAHKRLTEEAMKKGWKPLQVTQRNAFTTIPEPPKIKDGEVSMKEKKTKKSAAA